MKRRTALITTIVLLLLGLMIWNFGSSANTVNNRPDNLTGAEASNQVLQNHDDEDVDADLGKSASHIDREEYLRRRDEYVARKRGIEPGLPFNPQLRAEAIQQMERQEKGRLLESLVAGESATSANAGGAWTPIGPSPLPNGQGSNATSGRVTSIAIDPTNSNKVYLGTAQGGVWRSTDGGTNWTAIFDSANSLAIGALAVAPSNPSILYVGTGEFNACGDCFFGAGLYRIDNVDTSPSLVGPINTQVTGFSFNAFEGRSITRILVHPNDPATVFVSTGRGVSGSGGNGKGSAAAIAQRGVFKSTNAWPTSTPANVTFQRLTLPGITDADITDMSMEPGNADNIVAAANGSIYRTTNATAASPLFAQTVAANGGAPLSLGSTTRISLAINKIGSAVTVYAATSETPTNTSGCATTDLGAVRKSTDGGATWSDQLPGGGGFCADQCFYDMPVAVNPLDANDVYIGGQASSACGRLVGQATDGGATTFAIDSSGLHVDSHAIVFDGVGNIYTGNDGGVWKRSACASIGSAWTNLNTPPLNTLQFESIALHPTDRTFMIGGTQDNGTEWQQTSSGNWSQAEGGDGGYCLIDQSATDTVNVNMYHTFFNKTGTQIGFDRAVNTTCLPQKNFWPTRGIGFGGTSDKEDPSLSCDGTANYLHNGLSLTDSVLFYAPMALGPGSPNILYFGTDRLYRSTDRGDHMTVVSQAPISSGSPISTIGISSQDDNYRILGLQNGQVWATSTGSSTLVNLAPPIPANPTGSTNRFIGRAIIDPNNKDVAYITLSYYAPPGQGIWKITNLTAAAGGSPASATWTAAGNGLPSIPINAFAIDPQNSNNLYAGTDIGVYASSDGGASWSPFGSGLPRSAVFDIQIQKSSRILRAATHGRGIWEISIDGAGITPPPTPPTNTSTSNPIDVADNFVRQHYSDFLSRSPDTSGLNFWIGNIISCHCDQGCTEVKRIDTSAAFFLSIEFQQTGYLVEKMYKAAYGTVDGPSTLGGQHTLKVPSVRFSQFIPDTKAIGNGVVVGQGNWQAQLDANKDAFSQTFVQRATFTNQYPTSMAPQAFVNALNQNIGNIMSASEVATAVGRFNGAGDTSDVAARGKALRDVAENGTLSNQEFSPAFVLMQYFGYLRRDPNSGQDTDYTGYDFWLTKMNQFGGDFRAAEMVKAFITSIEYRQRFGTP